MKIKGIKVNGTLCQLQLTDIGSFITSDGQDKEIKAYIDENGGGGGSIGEITSEDGTVFVLKVNDNGELYAEEKINAVAPSKPTDATIKELNSNVQKLYLNSIYCGGDNADIHTMNYCTHNFVELSNLTNADIKLDGMSLQYLKGGVWTVLPLRGVIKSGGTFLVRGAACSNYDCAKIKVDHYDMEWKDAEGNPIKFTTESPSFYLCFGTEVATTSGWTEFSSAESRYIDLFGIKGEQACRAFVTAAYAYNKADLNTVMFRRYYAMDGVSQGTKTLDKRSNNADWYFVDLKKDSGELIPSIEDNTPKSRVENKNLYFDKTKLFENKPSIITCSFGIQATDNGEGATRCFNWVSKGRHNEFIWIRKEGETSWGTPNESFKQEIGLRKYYNRIVVEYGDGIVFTSHKFIKKGLTAGIYEYIAGRKNANGTPSIENCTEIRKFKVRTNEEVNSGFKYVHTSDQQGFNVNEYRIWQASANVIGKEYPDVHFMINTGDMTQNGSRIGEWLDYFNGKGEFLNNLEEMATVGNNDLSPKETYRLPDGSDDSKLSLDNFRYFYTYEIDEENAPVFTIDSVEYYIPSLYSFNYGNTHFMCVNSEIKTKCEKDVYGFEDYGNFYPHIKTWCENDIAKNKNTWNVAYCHEMPFTIMTTAVTKDYTAAYSTDNRGGASINVNANYNTQRKVNERYWFSEFCQTHDIRLVIGGHKHTQSTSYPMLENVTTIDDMRTVYSLRPIIVLKNVNDIKQFGGSDATKLVNGTMSFVIKNSEDTGSTKKITWTAKYPDTWVDAEGNVKEVNKAQAAFCEFKMLSDLSEGVTPVIYAMSQATSYKHTSNKELPSENIPWLKRFFGTNTSSANSGQKYPFFTIWENRTDKMVGTVRRVVGAFGGGSGSSNGKFDINKDGVYVLQGKCATDGEHDKDIYTSDGYTDKTIQPVEANLIIIEK